MNRRSFLQILTSAGVALVAAPRTVLDRAFTPPAPVAAAVPEIAKRVLVEGAQTFRIVFPDGLVAQLQGFVTHQTIQNAVDGKAESNVVVTPTGECLIEQEYIARSHLGETDPYKALPAESAKLFMNGQEIAALKEITLPRMTRDMIDVTSDGTFSGEPDSDYQFIPGLKRLSDMTFVLDSDQLLM